VTNFGYAGLVRLPIIIYFSYRTTFIAMQRRMNGGRASHARKFSL